MSIDVVNTVEYHAKLGKLFDSIPGLNNPDNKTGVVNDR
jgi:hypothetical protein